MLKSAISSQVSFINPKFFYEDPTDVMDEDIAKEIIDFITSDNTNGPLCRQKIHIGNQMHPKHYHGQWHIAHITSYAKHIQSKK
jgi:hypothetical protein